MNRTLRNLLWLGLALMALIGVQQVIAEKPAGLSEETEWSMDVELVLVDNCPINCPCLFGQEPHHGHCRFVGAAHIVEGTHGDTDLGGVNWALLGEFTGKSTTLKFQYAAYYIDSSASAAQKNALRAILSGAPFSTMGQQLGIKEAAIKLEQPSDQQPNYMLSIGDLGEYSVAPVYGNDPNQPLKVDNPVFPFPVSELTIGAASGKFQDHGKDLNLKDNSGEIGRFSLSGKTQ